MDPEKQPFCYMDNAATSWPKPPAVLTAIEAFYNDLGVSAERSGSSRAGKVERAIQTCRHRIASILSASRIDTVVFGFNGTDVLNLALHGVLKTGDHVIATVVDHNSVLRPLEYMKGELGITFSLANCDGSGLVCPESIEQQIQPNTKMVCMSHVSNVTGLIQPACEVGRICRDRDLLFLLDAAQSLGHFPLEVADIQCDLLAASGHKGLLGPLGTGVLWVGDRASDKIAPSRQGGTGTQSETMQHPLELPYRLEAGNLNSAGIMGLSAGLAYLEDVGLGRVQQHDLLLSGHLIDGLVEIDEVDLLGQQSPRRTGIVSFVLDGFEPDQVAAILDASFGIQVRAGLHCAPKMHEALGTFSGGGAIRISPGIFNSEQDVHNVISAVQQIATSK